MRHNRSRPGFTLLEMLVVLAILGLVVGIVLLRGSPRSPTLELRAAASATEGGLRLARARAIATNRPVRLTLDGAAHAWRIDGVAQPALPAGVAVGAQPPVISFLPDGSSSGGRVELAAGEARAVLAVDWLTGRVVSVP